MVTTRSGRTPKKAAVKSKSSKKESKKKASKVKKEKKKAEADEATAESKATKAVSGTPAAAVAAETPTAFQGESGKESGFQFWLFFWLIVENWVLDFGRPVANFYFRFLPKEMPGVGDWFHALYCIVTPFLLLKMLDSRASKNLAFLLVAVFGLGAGIHLVGDSVQAKLVQRCGYDLSMKVKDNAIMHEVKTVSPEIVDIFEMLYVYDEHIGHYLWYIPYFLAFILYFGASHTTTQRQQSLPTSAWALLPLGSSFYWYLIVEGQVWPLFLLTMGVMAIQTYLISQRGQVLDVNGRWLLYMFGLTFALFVVWLVYRDVPVHCVASFDLDCVPEFWESYPALTALLIGG